jgi:hypothetical protein
VVAGAGAVVACAGEAVEVAAAAWPVAAVGIEGRDGSPARVLAAGLAVVELAAAGPAPALAAGCRSQSRIYGFAGPDGRKLDRRGLSIQPHNRVVAYSQT